MSDYADKIADKVCGPYTLVGITPQQVRELVAEGVREGYNLASGVKS